MRVIDIYMPGIKKYVSYNVPEPKIAEAFAEANESLSQEYFRYRVIEEYVDNFKGELFGVLKKLSDAERSHYLKAIFNACVMLNPGLDIDRWVTLTDVFNSKFKPKNLECENFSEGESEDEPKEDRATKFNLTRAKVLGLEKHLKSNLIGQDSAVEALVSTLKRVSTGLMDENRPLAVFLFAGSSGVGKTKMAELLHEYVFNTKSSFIEINCGEYQQKHNVERLIGSPPGYRDSDKGGLLVKLVRDNPKTVILLDEVEKAHPDFWHTFLNIFAKGELQDSFGEVVSFKSAIIVMTTNLGNKESLDYLLNPSYGFSSGDQAMTPASRRRMEAKTLEAIRKYFTIELVNRIDDIVIFNHLTEEDLLKIAEIQLAIIGKKLKKKSIKLIYDAETLQAIADFGKSPLEGARGIEKLRRTKLEARVADYLFFTPRTPKGINLEIKHLDGQFTVNECKASSEKTQTEVL